MIKPLGALAIKLWGGEVEAWFRFPHENDVIAGGGGKGALRGANNWEKCSCTNIVQDTSRRPCRDGKIRKTKRT
jgi:hypothetical protein